MAFLPLHSNLFPIEELSLPFLLPTTPADPEQGQEVESIALSESYDDLPQSFWPGRVDIPYAEQDAAGLNNIETPSTGRRIRRRQNHSCDPCRLAKRACDLPLGVAIEGNKPPIACSMCSLRSTECTVAWLAGRKHSRPVRKRPARSSRSPSGLPAGETTRSPVHQRQTNDPSAEWDQARRFIAQDQCAQHVNLYIDVVDTPITACLSQRCMPPSYSLGIAALAPLSGNTDLSSYFERARSSINSCCHIHVPASASSYPAPQLFLTVSVLDAIFQNPGASARDNAIAEAFKWVAIAAATQFAAHETDQSPSHTKDIAFTSWQKAREVLFQNIGATGSFRLALSLVLFGAILPPTGSDQSSAWAEDVTFAHREGVRRLQGLCAKTRGNLQLGSGKASSLSPEVKPNLLELVGAIEWFFCMSHSATIVTSPNSRGPSALDIDYAAVKGFLLRPTDHEQSLERSIVARAQATDQPVATLWCQDILPDDELVYCAVNNAGSIVVLLFRSLALLTLASQDLLRGAAEYAEFQQHYTAVTRLIDSWRTSFGRITPDAISALGRLPAITRRCVLFCATDAELAILLFDELLRELNDRLAETEISSSLSAAAHDRLRETLRSTDPYRQDQRLISAMQISYLASTNIGVSSPGSQGGQGRGPKATVQDIGAHPQPALAVKAYTLAARTFADEMQSLVARVETQGVGEMANGLKNCLQALQALKQTLVMFPDPDSHDPYLCR